MREHNVEGTLATVLALLVLFTTMVDPRISIALALIALCAYALYSFLRNGTVSQ